MIFLFLFLTSLCIRGSRFIHPHHYKLPNSVPFYDWVIFHCICIPHLLYGYNVSEVIIHDFWGEIMKHYHFLSLSEIYLWSLEPPCKHGYPASCTLKRLWIALTQIQRDVQRSLAAAALPPTTQISSSLLRSQTCLNKFSEDSSPAFLIAPAWENVSENHQLSNQRPKP